MYHLERASLHSSHIPLRSPLTTIRRSTSNPQTCPSLVEHNPKKADKRLFGATEPVPEQPLRPDQLHRILTVDGPLTRTRPALPRSPAVRSSSDPHLGNVFINSKSRDRDLPLKSCIKKKAKSDTITPPDGIQQDMMEADGKRIRRVKTVDFKGECTRPSLLYPQKAVISTSLNNVPTHHVNPISSPGSKPREFARPSWLCPNTISKVKSSVADTAVTRTDVHVIAITPSWDARDITNEEETDPATPTMQIIETKSRSYEVVWDDVPPEHKIRVRGRRSSSASHSLETASPGARRGLERVNSKLAGWTGSWNSPSESFKPTIVVFPDDDGRATHYDCAVEDRDDVPLLAPPNSQVTSATSSCHPSRPASAPMTRAASHEDMSLEAALHEKPLHAAQDLLQPSLLVPNPEMHSKGRRNPHFVMFRQLSNLEEVDTKFRGHRDSVTMAHARLVRSGRVSPELFEGRDSSTAAKKRMYNRDHAKSAVRASFQPKALSTEALDLVEGNGISKAPLPTVKEHAAQALQSGSPLSILRSPQRIADQRHIRIVE